MYQKFLEQLFNIRFHSEKVADGSQQYVGDVDITHTQFVITKLQIMLWVAAIPEVS